MAGQVRVVVDGMTASGKSTMVKLLADELKLMIMPEMFEDPFELLPRYAYDAKWCLPMQLNFLVTRYSQYLVASESNNYILDRSIFSDKVYADLYRQMGHLDADQYDSYINLHDSLIRNVPKPECMVFLTCSFETIMHRIHKRGREFEIHQGEEYWRALYDAYAKHTERMVASSPAGSYLLINSEQLNFAEKAEDRKRLVEKVKAALAARHIETA